MWTRQPSQPENAINQENHFIRYEHFKRPKHNQFAIYVYKIMMRWYHHGHLVNEGSHSMLCYTDDYDDDIGFSICGVAFVHAPSLSLYFFFFYRFRARSSSNWFLSFRPLFVADIYWYMRNLFARRIYLIIWYDTEMACLGIYKCMLQCLWRFHVFTFSHIIPATSIKNRSHKTDYDFDEHIINNIVVEYTSIWPQYLRQFVCVCVSMWKFLIFVLYNAHDVHMMLHMHWINLIGCAVGNTYYYLTQYCSELYRWINHMHTHTQ